MKAEKFWKWFLETNEHLIMFNDLSSDEKTDLLKEFDENLKEYCEGITFYLNEQTPNGRSIIFSAEGDTDYFEEVVTLIENAPALDWWEFIPFKQPQGSDVKVQYEKLFFNSVEMYFLPLENEEELQVLGLQVAVPNFEKDNEDILIGTYVALESQIGEFDAATLIEYLEIIPIPEDVENTEYISLSKFPEFIEWFKKEKGLE